MKADTHTNTSKLNLVQFDSVCEKVWFTQFQELEDPLVQLLLLVAILSDRNLLALKEMTLFKQFLLESTEQKQRDLLSCFSRHKSLYKFRSEFRGHLGLPRVRPSDSINNLDNLVEKNDEKEQTSPPFRYRRSNLTQ